VRALGPSIPEKLTDDLLPPNATLLERVTRILGMMSRPS